MNRKLLLVAVLMALAPGCSDDDNTPADSGASADSSAAGDAGAAADGAAGATLTLTGKLVAAAGEKLPAKLKVSSLWMVGAVGPDYMYKLGEASATGATFKLEVTRKVPAAAISATGMGMANVAAVTHDTSVPDGKVAPGDLKKGALIGFDLQRALIYRPTTIPGNPLFQWLEAFPVGLSCGKFRANKTGFDPTDCASFAVTVAAAPKTPPWW